MYDFAIASFLIPYIWGQFDFLFYQCTSLGEQLKKTAEYTQTPKHVQGSDLLLVNITNYSNE